MFTVEFEKVSGPVAPSVSRVAARAASLPATAAVSNFNDQAMAAMRSFQNQGVAQTTAFRGQAAPQAAPRPIQTQPRPPAATQAPTKAAIQPMASPPKLAQPPVQARAVPPGGSQARPAASAPPVAQRPQQQPQMTAKTSPTQLSTLQNKLQGMNNNPNLDSNTYSQLRKMNINAYNKQPGASKYVDQSQANSRFNSMAERYIDEFGSGSKRQYNNNPEGFKKAYPGVDLEKTYPDMVRQYRGVGVEGR